MKRIYIILSVLFICNNSILNAQSQSSNYYYYNDEKIYLDISLSSFTIISEDSLSFEDIKTLIGLNHFKIEYSRKSQIFQNIILLDTISKNLKDIFMMEVFIMDKIDEIENIEIRSTIEKAPGVIQVPSIFLVRDKKIGISNNFYVKLRNASDVDLLLELAKKHSIHILGYNEYMPQWWTLSCTNRTQMNAMEAANLFYESEMFVCTEPEFLYYDLLASEDTFYSYQWGLNNTGQFGGTEGIDINAVNAWQLTTGSSNVCISIYDHGFEMDHPDLRNNVYGTGYDANSGTTPAQIKGSHGTACAGIAAAQQNNFQGVSGVAPNSKLMSISISLTFAGDTPQQLANGFNWAWKNGADIISNSWGGYSPSSIIMDAIDSTLTFGRNGKGTIIVFAAGNENDTNIRYPGRERSDIIVVGAMSPCGERKNPSSCDGENWGSCYGTQLDVVAPGVLISTTDRQGSAGYNPSTPIHTLNGGNKISNDFDDWDYTVWFNGTSAACPHVAGVAALILSINPLLTQQEVSDIIESTAQKVGDYTYEDNAIGRPNGSWCEFVGYGLVDAYAAVLEAMCYDGESQIVTGSIENNTTWNVNRYAVGTITIESGATLTIESLVMCAPNTQIIVKPNAKLIIDGGILTSSCENYMWQGIQVTGTLNQPQTAQYQGTVEIKNGAIIENAVCAVATHTNSFNVGSGGIIKAADATFKNNATAISFSEYIDNSGGLISSNKSYFKNCTFIVDDMSIIQLNDQRFTEHVSLWGVYGVNFEGCRFEITSGAKDAATNNYRAIYSHNSYFYVKEDCRHSLYITNCGCGNDAIRSNFTGFDKAVDASIDGKNYNFSIDRTDFYRNKFSVIANGVNNFSFIRSNIDFTQNPNNAIGLSIDFSTGYKVEKNNFYNKSLRSNQFKGIEVRNSNTSENIIYLNEFERLNYGIFITGTNNSLITVPVIPSGLQFGCNTFKDNIYDIFIGQNGYVRTAQGSLSKGADNNFLTQNTYNIYKANLPTLTYYYSNGGNHAPQPVSANVTTNSNAIANLCGTTLCNQDIPIDNKNSNGIQEDIDLYIYLNEKYSSLLEIFFYNGYDKIIQDHENGIIVDEKELLAAMQMREDLLNLSWQMAEISNNALQTIKTDSIYDLNKLIEWYSVINNLSAKYSLAEAYYQMEKYKTSFSILNEIPKMFNLSESEYFEHINYLAFYNLKSNLHKSGRNYFELKETEISELIKIAELNTGISSIYAQGVLCFFHDICFDLEEQPEKSTSLIDSKGIADQVRNDGDIIVYPNPGENSVTILTMLEGVVEFVNTSGQTLLKCNVSKGSNTIDVSSLPKGVYVYRMVSKEKLFTGKWVKM